MQERAAQTQQALIQAAAAEFDRRGYEGASLARISKRACTSMGALTFHFPTKGALADAVRAAGHQTVAPVARGVVSEARAPLVALADLTCTLVRILESDVVARAAVRLERDTSYGGPDAELALEWTRALRILLERAADADELRPGVLPDTVAVMLAWLVEGSCAESARGGPERPGRGG
ncbi:TetR family transcriptional regulator, partial [Streptomyces sp. NPDC058470]|uniref:TetR family transcriptional regulator n=1 Tax=Streptomyces sp. NPDC058470 TaxID=3346515 RepID=UPI0036474DF8